ncbi:MAG: glycerol-3-phosphate dehydrogenase/oxidase [Deltaproteobacteria bacterium]|nr:glycerol-3-phosphate dehydrogenase/oxidase [Deltaproteobacteria bacterium]
MSAALENLKADWDLVVIGGGITGAGIFRETVRMGLSVLLVEQQDFAWGTSSRSSKLVHGGLRYLKEGRIFLTRDAVRERERLLAEAPGLVELLGFLVPIYKGRGPGKWTLEAGLSLYDLIAKKRQHKYYDAEKLAALEPHLNQKGLVGGFHFFDAQVDDARLVLRLIFEAEAAGGCALNYTAAKTIHRNDSGEVEGVTLEDSETHESRFVSTGVVINATGCWAEHFHPSPDPKVHLRPLRGSHLIFSRKTLPVGHAVSFVHPVDERAIFLVPWEGAVIVGTTDLDYREDLSREPAISADEVNYLMTGLQTLFPSLDISEKDCISAISGIRPVLSKGGNRSPSEESREHVVWKDKGLLTITGGKLTTFRKLAMDAIKAAMEFLPDTGADRPPEPVFPTLSELREESVELSTEARRLFGRYGAGANLLISSAGTESLKPIPGTHTLWAELPYAAGHEQVRHLDDLLLRRVRIGLLVPDGAREYLPRIKKICRPVLPWNRRKWKREIDRYMDIRQRAYSLPSTETEPERFKFLPGWMRAPIRRVFH